MPETMTMHRSPYANLAEARRIYEEHWTTGLMFDGRGYCAAGALAAAWGCSGDRASLVKPEIALRMPELHLLAEALWDMPASDPLEVSTVGSLARAHHGKLAPWFVVTAVNDHRGHKPILKAFDDAMEMAIDRGMLLPQPVPTVIRTAREYPLSLLPKREPVYGSKLALATNPYFAPTVFEPTKNVAGLLQKAVKAHKKAAASMAEMAKAFTTTGVTIATLAEELHKQKATTFVPPSAEKVLWTPVVKPSGLGIVPPAAAGKPTSSLFEPAEWANAGGQPVTAEFDLGELIAHAKLAPPQLAAA